MTPQRELSLLAIQQPVEFEAEIRKHDTPAVILEEQKAIFAISQPKAYAAEFEKFKDNARREQESQARSAILKPVEFRAQHLTKRSPQKELEEELAARQMLNGNSRRLWQPNQTAPKPTQP